MPIFRYTFKKILVSPSTWVVFALTLVILSLGWLLVPFLASNSSPGGTIHWTPEAVKNSLMTWKSTAFFGLIGLMLFIFLGVKSVQIFRDEIDDGTLLILVSKPISRNRIWLEKWITFQVTVISYIFLAIFIPSLFLLIPKIAGTVYFTTLFPYMWILFGIALIFDLIFSSLAILISLVLNSKATVALMIGFAALVNIFASIIDPIISIPQSYFAASQAVKVFQLLEKSKIVTADDLTWFIDMKNQYLDNDKTLSTGLTPVVTKNTYIESISNLMAKVYKELIPDIKIYPNYYDPTQEKVALKTVADRKDKKTFTDDEETLAKHIFDIASVYRQWDAQSYEELMTGKHVGFQSKIPDQLGVNVVHYSVIDTFNGLAPIQKTALDSINSKIAQKKIMRYFNVFYQLSYLFNGIINQHNSFLFDSSQYIINDDPYLISYQLVAAGSGQYSPDLSADSNGKIINFAVLITMYVLLGTTLLGASWYLFNRRDFA